MAWFKRPTSNLNNDDGEPNGDGENEFGAESTFAPVSDGGPGRVRTEGLWIKCPSCRQILFKAELEKPMPPPGSVRRGGMRRPAPVPAPQSKRAKTKG